MKLRILYDNNALPGYQADWGFACLAEGQENVLFDTGADPAILKHNMERAAVEPGAVDKVVLSHDHWDHTGGLSYVVGGNADAEVFILPGFGPDVRSQLSPAVLREVTEPGEVSPGIRSTGPVEGQTTEQALVLDTDSGLVVITGCAHPGVDALMERAAARGEIHAVLGGFHGFARLDALAGIAFLAPCHCTQHTQAIAERFPGSYSEIKAGSTLEF